jgi:hypothetical protein
MRFVFRSVTGMEKSMGKKERIWLHKNLSELQSFFQSVMNQ